jgi:hypothetical protein
VDTRILSWGVAAGAFVLTLAFSYRHEGARRSEAPPSMPAATRPREAMATPQDGSAPAAATVNPTPAVAPPAGNEQRAADFGSEAGDAQMRARRGRAADRGSRTR